MMTMVAPTGKFGCLLSSTSATLLPIIVNGGFILGVVMLVMLVMVDVVLVVMCLVVMLALSLVFS